MASKSLLSIRGIPGTSTVETPGVGKPGGQEMANKLSKGAPSTGTSRPVIPAVGSPKKSVGDNIGGVMFRKK